MTHWRARALAAAAAATLLAGAGAVFDPAWAQARPGASSAAPSATRSAPARPQAARPASSMEEGVAAIVNDDVISTWDVRQRSLLILLSSGIEPTADALQQVRPQALRSLVDERLQLQEAKQYKVEIADAEVERAFEEVAQQNEIPPAAFAAQLASAGVNADTLKAQLKADIAWRRLVGGRFGSRVRISQARVRETIDRIVANSATPQYQISEILLATDTPDEQRQAVTAAERLLAEMGQGAPFPMVARQFSSAPTAAAGGDLGWLAQSEVRPELLPIVQRLQPGQVSRPIPTSAGVYIIALRDKRDGLDPKVVGQVTLLQVTAPAASRAALERAMRGVASCQDAEAAAGQVQGAKTESLGQVTLGDLTGDFRATVESLPDGRASAPKVEGDVATSFVVCERSAGAAAPSPDEVEDRLYQQEVAMLSQRYLRNLRREATIITR